MKREVLNSEANEKMLKILSLVMARVQAITPELEKTKRQIQSLLEAKALGGTRTKKQKQDTSPNGGVRFDDQVDSLMSILTMNPVAKDKDGSEREMEITDPEGAPPAGAILRWVEEEIGRMSGSIQVLIGDVGALKAAGSEDNTTIKKT
jgi:hypothetical protein